MDRFFLDTQHPITNLLIFFNEPSTKEAVKNVTGLISLFFAFLTIGLLLTTSFKRDQQSEEERLFEKKHSFFIFFASLSIFLTALTTRQGIKFLSSIEKILSFGNFNLFGEEAIFAVNPFIPKHILSIAALIFALIALKSGLKQINYKKALVKDTKQNEIHITLNKQEKSLFLLLVLFLTFNCLTSRPTLHLLNQLTQFLAGKLLETSL